jgi:hypothetical protein
MYYLIIPSIDDESLPEAGMKNILILLFLGLLVCFGCESDNGLQPIESKDFIGDWYMSGTLDLSLDGRPYTQEVGRTIYIREGFVTDETGSNYTMSLKNGILSLTRDNEFKGVDPYCGSYDGGTSITFVFPYINPLYDQAYAGTVNDSTSVYTQYCNYKPMIITGNVMMQRTF